MTEQSHPASSPQVKGRLIEDLVHRLHEHTGLLVRSRVRLPTIKNPKRKREIDVLIASDMLGRTMHLAFECKNYGKKIGVAKVGEFRDKLESVGIPVQHGIMITSAHGYTADALERATELGITMLSLDGLSDDRLATAVYEAFQSVVYILLSITHIAITTSAPTASWDELLFLRDRYGNLQGSVMDLVWAAWRDGQIPVELGEHCLSLRVPRTWRWKVDGTGTPSEVTVRVRTTAFVVTIPGTAEQVSLREVHTGRLMRTHISATFSEELSGNTFKVVRASTEKELEALLKVTGKVHIAIHRIPLPRIVYEQLYWPPSERAIVRLDQHLRQLIHAGQYDVDSYKLTFRELDGSDLSRIWDPVWSAHPASHDRSWPWTAPRRPRRTKLITIQPRGPVKSRRRRR